MIDTKRILEHPSVRSGWRSFEEAMKALFSVAIMLTFMGVFMGVISVFLVVMTSSTVPALTVFTSLVVFCFVGLLPLVALWGVVFGMEIIEPFDI